MQREVTSHKICKISIIEQALLVIQNMKLGKLRRDGKEQPIA